ncbi:cytochrome bd-I oxidase subunit CydX [Psychrobacter sp. YP14]|uniref:Cytochrome bd-I oxidase subunit CydX n=3 Tax=Psychrobacter TaxID=497 RepID=A0A844LYK6_9GAMM|nr:MULTISPECIES: cytochrome bd-I oxidase subunit CydX [Psychrobacter]AWT48365.1 cytochrome bd-I oxidase subunit CydX [Psychrobacter sp. YP14]MUG31500.1 cytochrome bd-I oxidase subunit CydX [Psychrobacter sanguinis]UNK05684.1 cytochrome bd-I oxidase subunit CydX [Psychrobacter sp. PraFG1]
MWYFAWILGLGFAVLLAIVNAVWLEHEQGRLDSYKPKPKPSENPNLNKTLK